MVTDPDIMAPREGKRGHKNCFWGEGTEGNVETSLGRPPGEKAFTSTPGGLQNIGP